jgi:hypothetical protein
LAVRARCKHYRRRCRIRAPCCNDVFSCRHCHNESTVCSALLCSVLPRFDSYHGHVPTCLSHPDISFDLCLPSTCCSWIGLRKTGTSSTAMLWNRCASSLSLFSVFCFTVRRVSFSYCANKLKLPFPVRCRLYVSSVTPSSRSVFIQIAPFPHSASSIMNLDEFLGNQIAQVCTNCGVCMGEYFCRTCKFLDDDVRFTFPFCWIFCWLALLMGSSCSSAG